MGDPMDVVRIFDTTLRDGEQSPGFSMNTEEKIRLARQLAALNVDVIEAGFPIASRGDLEAVKKVAQEVRNVPIAALARARKEDVSAAIEALKPAASPRLHVFLATSDLHLSVKLKMTREQALEAIGSMIRYGRQHVAEVEFSAEDAGRTDIGFLCQVCRVALAVRQDSFGVTTGIRLEQLFPTSRMLTEITGAQVAPNKAIVGANAFAHEAGIHQDGIIKNPLTYEIISPQTVGVPARSLVLGKHSGRNALRMTLRDLGYEASETELAEVYSRVTALADQSKQVRPRDLVAIAHEVIRRRSAAMATETASARK